jgi:hypothetical protein
MLAYTLGYVQLELAASPHRLGASVSVDAYAARLVHVSPSGLSSVQGVALAACWTEARFERGLCRWMDVSGLL